MDPRLYLWPTRAVIGKKLGQSVPSFRCARFFYGLRGYPSLTCSNDHQPLETTEGPLLDALFPPLSHFAKLSFGLLCKCVLEFRSPRIHIRLFLLSKPLHGFPTFFVVILRQGRYCASLGSRMFETAHATPVPRRHDAVDVGGERPWAAGDRQRHRQPKARAPFKAIPRLGPEQAPPPKKKYNVLFRGRGAGSRIYSLMWWGNGGG